jgi:hypothetical protein
MFLWLRLGALRVVVRHRTPHSFSYATMPSHCLGAVKGDGSPQRHKNNVKKSHQSYQSQHYMYIILAQKFTHNTC